MKTLLSMLVALIMVLTMSQSALVQENIHTDPGIALAAKEPEPAEAVIDLELPPVADFPFCEPDPISEKESQAIHREADPVAAPPAAPASVCTPPVQETEPEEGTIDREADPVAVPPAYAPESACVPPIQETEPEEGTIDLEGEGVACPPPCEPAPISDEEPETPEETIALEPDPIVGPPVGEP